MRFALAHLLAVYLRQGEAGARLLERPDNWLPGQVDVIRAEPGSHAEFVIDETNYFIQERVEAAQGSPPFDPKTIFKSANGVRQLERQVVEAVKALARRPNSDVLFDVDPEDDET